MWKQYHIIETQTELAEHLAKPKGLTRIIAGGTDLMVELKNGKLQSLHTLLDISRCAGLDQISQDGDGIVHIGALVTHNDVLKSDLLRQYAWPLVQACYKVATPQLRNLGTVVGNLVTASPANDTITPLMALEASLVLVSKTGKRIVPLANFYTGVRKTVLRPDEFVREVQFKGMKDNDLGSFRKSALRRTQAIATINACVIARQEDGLLFDVRVTLGSVAPTIIHAPSAEAMLTMKSPSLQVAVAAGRAAAEDAKPISDLRASKEYRSYMVAHLVQDIVMDLANPELRKSIPVHTATLSAGNTVSAHPAAGFDGKHIETKINGKPYRLEGGVDLTLLHLVRELVGLTGTKNGCEEGECGACTLYLDGKAVVSCLVPAGRAHNAEVQTIEGIAKGDQLHPVQQAFIDHAAVQCGYCTPGFVMSAVKLLQEEPHPDRAMIKEGISGNLCRCTGYYKIIEAIEDAARAVEN